MQSILSKMKKVRWIGRLIPGIIFTLLYVQATAQYTTAFGVRVGGTTGLTIKHVFKTNTAIEGIVGTFGNGFSVTGLIEKQKSLNASGLFFLYGGGIHVAFYDGSSYENIGRDVRTSYDKGVGFGIDGILGLEYRLPNVIPIVFAIDSKPFVEIGQGNSVGFALDPSISVKFVIK